MCGWYWVREKLFCLKSFKCSSFFFFGKIGWLSLIVFSFIIGVRLNLINHFVGFISCQFACNSAFRNLVFRWDSCKGSVWESLKKSSRVCTQQGLVTRSRGWLAASKSPKEAHMWSMQGSWRVTPAEALQNETSSHGQVVSSRLRLAT